MSRENWIKHLSVDKRIVRLLSATTYESFPDAIREMVSNAYDADATEVYITIDLKQDLIEVKDNGNGMSPEDFEFFLRIAGQKRDKKRLSPVYNRRQIGQFGIGFLAIFPFGKKIEITSTANRSSVLFKAVVPAERYVREGQSIDVDDVEIPGYQIENKDYFEQHGTTITISGLTDMVRRFFSKNEKGKIKKDSVLAFDPLDKIKWIMQEDLPLDYPKDSVYSDALKDLGSSGIRIWLNNEELFRNTPATHILENSSWEDGNIKCRYVIATNWKILKPVEARYYKIRLRNVGVGARNPLALNLAGKLYSKLNWITGELFILEGLDNTITIDRSRFVENPEFDNLVSHFRQRLAYYSLNVENIAQAGRDINRQMRESRVAKVGSKRDVVQTKVEQLKKKGFEVVVKSSSQSSKSEEPVKIDFDNKTIEIVEDHPAFSDTVFFDGQEYLLKYIEWSDMSNPPIRKNKQGEIEINTKYPIFLSGRYGEVFKKVLLVAFLLSEQTRSSKELYTSLSSELLKEFRDFKS